MGSSGQKKMGPKGDPPRPLGVKHKGIASFKEHGYAPYDHLTKLGDRQSRDKYRLNLVLFHIWFYCF